MVKTWGERYSRFYEGEMNASTIRVAKITTPVWMMNEGCERRQPIKVHPVPGLKGLHFGDELEVGSGCP